MLQITRSFQKKANTTAWCGALLAAVLLVGSVSVSFGQRSDAAKLPAKKTDPVRRLQVPDVPGLPPEFVVKLTARNCAIPQFDAGAGAGAEQNNVIHGEFAHKGQEDWAALCSNGKSSTIVIFWGKETSCPASLARLEDAHYLKSGAAKTLRYSRQIRALGESELGERAGMSAIRPLSHQGIDDRFVGKSSSFFYCNEGKWRIFPAKDSSTE